MIIVMKPGATEEQIAKAVIRVKDGGLAPHISRGELRTIIGVVGSGQPIDQSIFTTLAGVENVVRIVKPYKLASREFKKEPTIVKAGDARVGGDSVTIMAGPCAVESRDQTLAAARAVAAAGAKILRGGAFKPRTSPYSFQGLREEGLKILAEAREETGLAVVTEVVAPQDVDVVASYADILQIGTRNVQNFSLLEAVGKTRKPVLLKRGLMGTIEELLMSAEYILSGGNPNVILCERGIRSFETLTRSTLDISAVPILKELTHLPVIVDPSHATGRRQLVAPVSRAAVAAGADGLIIEVHPNPDEALCDGAQSLTPEGFQTLMTEVKRVAEAVGRTV